MNAQSRSFHGGRPAIYQLMVRTFGNTNETRKISGTIEENGCGKFSDINHTALCELKKMGFTHVWLTGVLEQASATDYPDRPGDDPAILKGLAGSPYAIKDYFDVCPDYANDPDKRLAEFKALLERCDSMGLKVIIDFVPNHVARSYQSDVRPELSFGEGDQTDKFFDRDNHFYYLQEESAGGGPPVKLPLPDSHELVPFMAEAEFGRVTGNNAITWSPSVYDWYETVKLNYGHDFTKARDTSHLPAHNAPASEVPRTWQTMDEILKYWQDMGVSGFRCDMAHMVPMEFWAWAVRNCRKRDSEVFFMAEAYDNDPAKVCAGNVLDKLLRVGFDAVYDDPVYDVMEGIYDDGKWANDLDVHTFTGARFHKSLRYAENHDEVRLANRDVWGGHGMQIGKPVSAVLFSMGSGPIMLYNGQEVGEPADGDAGFGGGNARTTIFDYWSMPEFCKWVNGGKYDGEKLSDEQRSLRDWYGKLIRVTQAKAFTAGCFFGLNHSNKTNPNYGRLDGETVSGHWLYAFLRRCSKSGNAFMVVANLHPSQSMDEVKVCIPEDARMFIGHSMDELWTFQDRLDTEWCAEVDQQTLEREGVQLPRLEPCSAMMIEVTAGESCPR